MRKKLNLLFGLVLIIGMIALIGCGGSGKTREKNPYEGKWVAVSAQMMGMSVSIDESHDVVPCVAKKCPIFSNPC